MSGVGGRVWDIGSVSVGCRKSVSMDEGIGNKSNGYVWGLGVCGGLGVKGFGL